MMFERCLTQSTHIGLHRPKVLRRAQALPLARVTGAGLGDKQNQTKIDKHSPHYQKQLIKYYQVNVYHKTVDKICLINNCILR